MPHSDFLAWLNSATLKDFISGVLTRIFKNDDVIKNEVELKNDDYL